MLDAQGQISRSKVRKCSNTAYKCTNARHESEEIESSECISHYRYILYIERVQTIEFLTGLLEITNPYIQEVLISGFTMKTKQKLITKQEKLITEQK